MENKKLVEIGINLRIKLIKLLKEIQYNTPLRRYFFPRYPYDFTAPQLCFLCQCINDTKDVKGAIAEVGCANGATTLFLNNYMDAKHIEKQYYAIDSFSGFVAADIEYEVTKRGKTKNLFTGFRVNKKKWFDGAIKQGNVSRVLSIEADVNQYDLLTLGSLSFVLLDVDLYRPTIKSIRELYKILNPGGIIVVDDCDSKHICYDGADQAYKEFVKEINKSINIVCGRLGIINKPAS